MGLRRSKHEEVRRFQMREDLISIGDDYWIEDDSGNKVFRVDGKALRFRDTWILEDGSGTEVAQIREKKLSVRNAIKIEFADGGSATVKKEIVSIRDRFHVEVEHGDDLTAKGNIVDHEYDIERTGDRIATVSKKWFRVRETYGVEVLDPSDVVVALAVTVAIDGLTSPRG